MYSLVWVLGADPKKAFKNETPATRSAIAALGAKRAPARNLNLPPSPYFSLKVDTASDTAACPPTVWQTLVKSWNNKKLFYFFINKLSFKKILFFGLIYIPAAPAHETYWNYSWDKLREPKDQVELGPKVAVRLHTFRRMRPDTQHNPIRREQPVWCQIWARCCWSVAGFGSTEPPAVFLAANWSLRLEGIQILGRNWKKLTKPD